MRKDTEKHDLDQLSESLDLVLARLQREIGSLVDVTAEHDPARTLSALNSLGGELDTGLEELHGILDSMTGRLERDFNVLIQAEIDAVVKQLELPLIVRSRSEEGLPSLAAAVSQPIRAALHRVTARPYGVQVPSWKGFRPSTG